MNFYHIFIPKIGALFYSPHNNPEILSASFMDVPSKLKKEDTKELQKSDFKVKFPDFYLGENETMKIAERSGTMHTISTFYRFGNFFQNGNGFLIFSSTKEPFSGFDTFIGRGLSRRYK